LFSYCDTLNGSVFIECFCTSWCISWEVITHDIMQWHANPDKKLFQYMHTSDIKPEGFAGC